MENKRKLIYAPIDAEIRMDQQEKRRQYALTYKKKNLGAGARTRNEPKRVVEMIQPDSGKTIRSIQTKIMTPELKARITMAIREVNDAHKIYMQKLSALAALGPISEDDAADLNWNASRALPYFPKSEK